LDRLLLKIWINQEQLLNEIEFIQIQRRTKQHLIQTKLRSRKELRKVL